MKSELKTTNESLLRSMSSELTLQREIQTGQVDPQDKEALVIKSKYENYLMSIFEKCLRKLGNDKMSCEEVQRQQGELLSKINAQETAITGLDNDIKTLSGKVASAPALSVVPSATIKEENQTTDPPPRKRWRNSVWKFVKSAFVGNVLKNYHFWIVFEIVGTIAWGIYMIVDNKNLYLEQTARLEWLDAEFGRFRDYRAARFEVNQLIDEVGTDSVRVLIKEKKKGK